MPTLGESLDRSFPLFTFHPQLVRRTNECPILSLSDRTTSLPKPEQTCFCFSSSLGKSFLLAVVLPQYLDYQILCSGSLGTFCPVVPSLILLKQIHILPLRNFPSSTPCDSQSLT